MAGHSNNKLPKDAQVIISMLKECGVTDYESRVVNQLLEYAHRYVTGIVDEAKVYAQHAKKKVIDLEDVKLASSMQMDHYYSTPPPRDILMEVAKGRNSMVLPPVKPHHGLRLPSDRYCLSACNYKQRSSKKTIIKAQTGSSLLSNSNMCRNTSMGMKLSSNSGGMRVVSTLQPAGPMRPKINTIPKPIIKFSSPGNISSNTPTLPKIQISSGSAIHSSTHHRLGTSNNSEGNSKRKRETDD